MGEPGEAKEANTRRSANDSRADTRSGDAGNGDASDGDAGNGRD